jgi:hypothetical protein
VGEAEGERCTKEGWQSRPNECRGSQEIVTVDEGTVGSQEEGSLERT